MLRRPGRVQPRTENRGHQQGGNREQQAKRDRPAALGPGSGSSTSSGYPGVPVKDGYGLATSDTYDTRCVA